MPKPNESSSSIRISDNLNRHKHFKKESNIGSLLNCSFLIQIDEVLVLLFFILRAFFIACALGIMMVPFALFEEKSMRLFVVTVRPPLC